MWLSPRPPRLVPGLLLESGKVEEGAAPRRGFAANRQGWPHTSTYLWPRLAGAEPYGGLFLWGDRVSWRGVEVSGAGRRALPVESTRFLPGRRREQPVQPGPHPSKPFPVYGCRGRRGNEGHRRLKVRSVSVFPCPLGPRRNDGLLVVLSKKVLSFDL